MSSERDSERYHAAVQKLIETVVLDMLRCKNSFGTDPSYAYGVSWEHAEAFLKLARKYPKIEID
jgi:hypothetical protein